MQVPASKIRTAKLELYRKKGKIHAKAVSGRFNQLRWLIVWLTQIVFYGTCWLNWENAGQVRQAVLFDIAHDKFYLFGLVLWPQDALLLALTLIIGATALFMVTALYGRLFCGFACPQTVYTSMFTWIEAKIEGNHLARLKLDQSGLSLNKVWRRLAKHSVWLLLAVWTGITFVGYFTPIRTLLPTVADLSFGPWEAFWLMFYSAFTYIQAGLVRESVCLHMCPYSRFQGVMFDTNMRTVSYDHQRGEPRQLARQSGTSGDCIDCGICVQVCPTGIDIRDGLQYQCINCGLCADACNTVMERVKLPTGLIRFASENELSGQTPAPKAWGRPRTLAYGGLLLFFTLIGVLNLEQRSPLLVDILRDRGALLREMADGRIENAYTLKLMNRIEAPQSFVVEVSGVPGLEIIGQNEFATDAGSIRPIQLTLSAPAESGLSGIQPIQFRIAAKYSPSIHVLEKSSFVLP